MENQNTMEELPIKTQRQNLCRYQATKIRGNVSSYLTKTGQMIRPIQ